ncbi:MAG: hypothetical protein ABI681_13385, partial [Gemmatimonadales bacterium]
TLGEEGISTLRSALSGNLYPDWLLFTAVENDDVRVGILRSYVFTSVLPDGDTTRRRRGDFVF